MNVLFIGASTFGFDCLCAIAEIDDVRIAGVISNNRTFSISYNKAGVQNVLFADFEDYCNKNKFSFYRMQENMKELGLLTFINNASPDLIVVIGWYHMIPKIILDKYQVTGIHASFLPNYSGGAPLVWAIINGETKTGVTFFYFDEGVDSGDIIAQEEIPILDTDTIKTIQEKAGEKSKQLLKKYLPLLSSNNAPRIKQDNSKRRVFPQRTPEDGEINWNWDVKRIKNFIRALTKPYPGAYTILKGKKIIIWDADVTDISS